MGIANIYVLPYLNTVQALYYENFKQRALQEGTVSQTDFLNDMERAQFNQNTYYNPYQTQPSYDAQQDVYNVAPQNGYSAPPQNYNAPQQNGYSVPQQNNTPDDTLPPYYYNGN